MRDNWREDQLGGDKLLTREDYSKLDARQKSKTLGRANSHSALDREYQIKKQLNKYYDASPFIK